MIAQDAVSCVALGKEKHQKIWMYQMKKRNIKIIKRTYIKNMFFLYGQKLKCVV